MDKHFAAMEEGDGACSKEERAAWRLHLCFRIRLHAGKYPYCPPPPPHTHTLTHLPPPSLFSLLSLQSLQHNWFSLLQFPDQENPPHSHRIRLRWHNDQFSIVTVCQKDKCKVDKKPFHNEPVINAGDVIWMRPPDQSCHITSSLCASSKKLTPVVRYLSPDLPSPDGH